MTINSLLQQEICIRTYFSNFRLYKQGNFKKNNILKIRAFFSFLNLMSRCLIKANAYTHGDGFYFAKSNEVGAIYNRRKKLCHNVEER